MQGNGGTGLGLNIVRQLLRLHHDSQLEIESQGKGRGTCFRLRIRCELLREGEGEGEGEEQAQAQAPPAHAASGRPPIAPPQHGRPRTALATLPHRPVLATVQATPPATPEAAGRGAELAAALASADAAATTGRGCGPALAEPRTVGSTAAPGDGGVDARVGATGIVGATGGDAGGDDGGDMAPLFPPGYRVLHVEDDAFVRLTLPMSTFEPLGVPFDQVDDGEQAVELYKRGARHSAIVVDNQMPILNGTATVRALRELGCTALIIGVTGDPPGCHERNCFQAAGLDMCLDKDTDGLHQLVDVLKADGQRLLRDASPVHGATRPLEELPTEPSSLLAQRAADAPPTGADAV